MAIGIWKQLDAAAVEKQQRLLYLKNVRARHQSTTRKNDLEPMRLTTCRRVVDAPVTLGPNYPVSAHSHLQTQTA
jgi:hypothetical protein